MRQKTKSEDDVAWCSIMARCVRESGAMISCRRECIGNIHAVILEDRTAKLKKHNYGVILSILATPRRGDIHPPPSMLCMLVIITEDVL